MDRTHDHALIYEVNTRAWLSELGEHLGRPATLDDIPDFALDRIAGLGFKWVWLLGVWRLGQRGPEISRKREDWREEFRRVLPDLVDEDISGSCFALTGHAASPKLGGAAALGRLRRRLRARSLRLILDFVPNHTALDHPWLRSRPDYYVYGTEDDLIREPHNYCRIETGQGPRIIAYGRDPFFPGWPDTAQLNYGNPELQKAMCQELVNVAAVCDGVRCDMAMLVLPDVFKRTWGIDAEPFWRTAIDRVRSIYPDFVIIAEVYWDLEWKLQNEGFDFTYDKMLYDRLRGQNAKSIRDHLAANVKYQSRLVRFLENHDEPRANSAFPPSVHQAAAILTYLSPGLRFFFQGQMEGFKVHVPIHLSRAPAENPDPIVRTFYQRLLKILRRPVVRSGQWQLLKCLSISRSETSADSFIASGWHGHNEDQLIVVVNYGPEQGQCRIRLPFDRFRSGNYLLRDLLGETALELSGRTLITRGLDVDLPPWGYRVFETIRSV
ncbi:MAG: alpha-amylase [Hyphomicrobiales bacterium]|nr:alpha-amylase [Hyphomicrobiales bacterium]